MVVRVQILVVASLLLLSACDNASSESLTGHEETCQSICNQKADCQKACSPEEEPGCDEQENYNEIYAECSTSCGAGESKLDGACVDAAALFADCFSGAGCGALQGSSCTTEEMRYRELCVTEPGDSVCGNFCAELEVGCLPYTEFGLRGKGCESACRAAVTDLNCLEALYTLDACTEGARYSCGAWSGSCDAEAAAVADACEAWSAVEADGEEVGFCEAVAQHQCACDLFSGNDCEAMAVNRCLYSLGRGQECRQSTDAFDQCMDAIDACDRDKLKDTCLDEWNLWSSKC